VIDPFLLYSLVSVALFCIGVHGLVVRAHLLHKLLALNIVGSAAFLFLVAVAYRNRDAAPDPVPHAMVLTGIVVAVSATAFALALARRIHAIAGQVTLDDAEEPE
jgi:multicomponent Na+:H+ antiporter subunit C